MHGMFGGRWLWRTMFVVSVLYGALWASNTLIAKAGGSWFALFGTLVAGAFGLGFLVYKLMD